MWAETEDIKLSGKEVPAVEADQSDIQLSTIDKNPHVETITEENEPDSNISALLNDSRLHTPSPQNDKVENGSLSPDQMDIRDTLRLTSRQKDKPKQTKQRKEMNSTMENFNKRKGSENTQLADMRTTAKFGSQLQRRHSVEDIVEAEPEFELSLQGLPDIFSQLSVNPLQSCALVPTITQPWSAHKK